jgi:protein tyrosine phosphatase
MVTLQGPSDHLADNYINANYIANPFNGEKKYFIATQGPIPKSMNNFWRMIWNEAVTVVVMLCGLQEHGRVVKV